MINLEELIRAELKQYIDANDDIKPEMETRLMKVISELFQGDSPSMADIEKIFAKINVEV